MPSIPRSPARRKPAEERHAEIVSTAGAIALAEGLESLTLRRVALELGVRPGLVSHYFPVVDELVAAAFGAAAAGELGAVFAKIETTGTSMARLRRLIDLLSSEDYDEMSLLWLNAWHAGRHRPALREEVGRQTRAWQDRIAELITAGVAAGELHTEDPHNSAVRILAMIDGLSLQAAMRTSVDYRTVREMVVSAVERELGLTFAP